ncbi:MAG: molybdate ABC transporter substrate-binding protein, partial [Prosthecochloris sp.]
DINKKEITRVGLPDSAKAIYGDAAMQYLTKSGLIASTRGKLLKLSTVPQVSSYLITKEIDAGFINLTDAIGVADDIGGYIVAEPSNYTVVALQAGVIKGFENDPDVQSFIEYLKTKEARNILTKYGL